MNLVELAQRIKQLRLKRRLTLEQVAQRTGLTRSWLSKVENFRITPSLPALGKIAGALEVGVAQLVEGLDERPPLVLVRRDQRKPIRRDRPKSNIVYQSLAHKRTGRRMDPFLLLVPAGETSRPALAHEGEEFLFVVSGRVEFEYGDQLMRLQQGDSLYFEARVKHRLINSSSKPAQVLCVFHDEAERNGLSPPA